MAQEERRDLVVTTGGARRHWRHAEGHRLSLADFHTALENHPELLVIGTGASGGMRLERGLVETLRKQGVQVEVMRTDAAVERVNDLVDEGGVRWAATSISPVDRRCAIRKGVRQGVTFSFLCPQSRERAPYGHERS